MAIEISSRCDVRVVQNSGEYNSYLLGLGTFTIIIKMEIVLPNSCNIAMNKNTEYQA